MSSLIEKFIILVCCSVFLISNEKTIYVIPIIITILSISSLISLFDNYKFSFISLLLIVILCCFFTSFLYFIPLIIYDVVHEKKDYFISITIIPFIVNFHKLPFEVLILLLFLMLVGYLIKRRTLAVQKLRNDYIHLRDETTELSSSLERKNIDLMEKQDYEINLATLNERNRIAGEIHDNVGHLLSSSIIQIGALIAISKDDNTKAHLNNVKGTLSSGMDSIRNSIHNIYENSIDLHSTLITITEAFSFCSCNLDYNIETDAPMKTKFSIIYIVKEALSNVMKHSNSSEVNIILLEHPALYQLIISDNGTTMLENCDNGIGLTNICDRIRTLDGIVNIDKKSGFRIFISIPKRKEK